MPYYCTVPRCTSMAGKAKNVSFHQFPRDEEMAKLWNDILKRGKPYTKYSKVCSLHFTSADYTITSVGKNKGQWRTLRKDAIPSRNLPSESPAPSRVRSSSSLSNTPPPESVVQQHMAHAIYMQTMLAMQANAEGSQLSTETLPSKENSLSEFEKFLKNRKPTLNIKTEQSQSDSDNETLHGDPFFNDDKIKKSFKCDECSKCFKDPDVFYLHQRTHNKTRNEKENVHINALVQQRVREETLKSNPILANLLKSNLPPNQNISEQFNNINSYLNLEHHIMATLSANMEQYINTMLKSQNSGNPDNSNDELSNDETVEKLVIVEEDGNNTVELENGNSNSGNPRNSDNESTNEEVEEKLVIKKQIDVDDCKLDDDNSNSFNPDYSDKDMKNVETEEEKAALKDEIDVDDLELENGNSNSFNPTYDDNVMKNVEVEKMVALKEEIDVDTHELENDNSYSFNPANGDNNLINEIVEEKSMKIEKVNNSEESEDNNINLNNSYQLKSCKESEKFIVVLEEVSDFDTSGELEKECSNDCSTKKKRCL